MVPNERRFVAPSVFAQKGNDATEILLALLIVKTISEIQLSLISDKEVWTRRIIQHYKLGGSIVMGIRLNNDSCREGMEVAFVWFEPLLGISRHGIVIAII